MWGFKAALMFHKTKLVVHKLQVIVFNFCHWGSHKQNNTKKNKAAAQLLEANNITRRGEKESVIVEFNERLPQIQTHIH